MASRRRRDQPPRAHHTSPSPKEPSSVPGLKYDEPDYSPRGEPPPVGMRFRAVRLLRVRTLLSVPEGSHARSQDGDSGPERVTSRVGASDMPHCQSAARRAIACADRVSAQSTTNERDAEAPALPHLDLVCSCAAALHSGRRVPETLPPTVHTRRAAKGVTRRFGDRADGLLQTDSLAYYVPR